MSRRKKSASADPQAEREARRYKNPIASREAILELMEQRGELMKREHLATALEISGEEGMEALRRRLQAMIRDGQLLRNRRGGYGVAKKLDAEKGRVIGHPDGFGFVSLDSGGDDWYLSSGQMRQVFHGDRVLVRIKGIDNRKRVEGTIISVLERAYSHLVGRFFTESGVAFVVADEKRISQDILVPTDAVGNARNGDFVYLEITEQPDRKRRPVGRVMEVLGHSINAPMAVEVAIRNYDLPVDWPQAVSKVVIPDHVSEEEAAGRKDLRDTALVTIDGFDAKDFDDAVFCRPRKAGGWTLLVAIADVSHYVKPGSALDDEARNRSTSVYFPNRVIPMLPEGLSNGICSLRPQVDRLCMVCEMQVAADGKVERSRFFRAVMHSHARLTYSEAWAFLDRGEGDYSKAVADSLHALHELYRAFRKRRTSRGAIDFRGREVRFRFDDSGEVEAIDPVTRNDAHKLIEECMIAANVEAAHTLAHKKIPTAFRVHPAPQERKLENLRAALAELAIVLPGGDDIKPKYLAKILDDAKERPDRDLIEVLILRAQSLAVYQPKNGGHFGLALDAYSHFTSPIRRYPDLAVHRSLKSMLPETDKSEASGSAELEKLCDHASLMERRAEEASRDVDDRLKCAFMQAHLGDEFDATVTGVREFGLFVELDNLQVSGLAHVTTLPNDYYHFDPHAHTLTGEKRRKSFRLADRIRVQIIRVDVDERQIDFKVVDGSGGG